MGKQQILAGLDMGSGRVTCAIASQDAQTQHLKLLAGASVPCRGLKGGVVVNIAETARAINLAVEEAESKSKQVVRGVYLGVRGKHLQSFNNRGAYNIARSDKEITAEDVANVIENAKAIPISNDREILHVIPQGFTLDRQRGVPNPVGMEGGLLEAEVHIVTASSSHLNNLIKAVNQAGFEVVEPVYGLLAVSEVVVTPEERDLGCLLIDLGGQTVSAAICFEGSLRFSKELEIGSDYISRDIAYALRTSMPTATKIKERHGVALSSLLNGDKAIKFLSIDGQTERSAPARQLVEIIQPRIEEIFSAVKDEFAASAYAEDLPAGAVLTGGGSMLRGMVEASEQILETQVRPGRARRELFDCEDESLLDVTYTTAVGLVCYPTLRAWGGLELAGTVARGRGWRRAIASWFEDLF